MALTWGQGVDEDQYAAMGINPSYEGAWAQYMKATSQLPGWVGTKDDFEAYQNGWVRGPNGQWIDAGTDRDDYRQSIQALSQAMNARQGEFFRAGMPSSEYEAGYRDWVSAYQAAEEQVRERLGVKLQAKMPWDQLSFNRMKRGRESAAMFDSIFSNLGAGAALWQHNGSDLATRAADYGFAFGDGAKYSQGRLNNLADFGKWMQSETDPTKRANATKAYGQWDSAYANGQERTAHEAAQLIALAVAGAQALRPDGPEHLIAGRPTGREGIQRGFRSGTCQCGRARSRVGRHARGAARATVPRA